MAVSISDRCARDHARDVSSGQSVAERARARQKRCERGQDREHGALAHETEPARRDQRGGDRERVRMPPAPRRASLRTRGSAGRPIAKAWRNRLPEWAVWSSLRFQEAPRPAFARPGSTARQSQAWQSALVRRECTWPSFRET